jgi:hypothetical protein
MTISLFFLIFFGLTCVYLLWEVMAALWKGTLFLGKRYSRTAEPAEYWFRIAGQVVMIAMIGSFGWVMGSLPNFHPQAALPLVFVIAAAHALLDASKGIVTGSTFFGLERNTRPLQFWLITGLQAVLFVGATGAGLYSIRIF